MTSLRVLGLVTLLGAVGCATQPVRPAPAANATEAGPRSFDHKPQPGENATCPVSGDHFVVAADTKIIEYQGRWYAFCCADCPKDFEANPAKYAGP